MFPALYTLAVMEVWTQLLEWLALPKFGLSTLFVVACAISLFVGPNMVGLHIGEHARTRHALANVKAAGVKLDDAVMTKIDDVLGDVVVRDAAMTKENAPQARVA